MAAQLKHQRINNQLPLFIEVTVLSSTKDTMEQMLGRHDRFREFSGAWSRYGKR